MPLLVMGVVNVTPDSFSDGGRWIDPEKAIAQGLQLIADGADIVDVGGESTRPGAQPVTEAEEIARVVPVIEGLASVGKGRISIDTMKPAVAKAAVAAGATLLNDVSASLDDVAADLGVGWVAMHMQGDPRTMQQDPHYDDVVAEVSEFLFDRAEGAKQKGVNEIWIDPGIGFGKALDHNLALLAHLDVLTSSSYPVAVGVSRKSFLGKLTGSTSVDDRLAASLAAAIWSANQGVGMVRVHDVADTVRAFQVLEAMAAATTSTSTSGGERQQQSKEQVGTGLFGRGFDRGAET